MTSHWLFTSAIVLALSTPAWTQTTTYQPTTAPPPPAAQPTTTPEATTAPAAGTTGPKQSVIPEQAPTTLLAKDVMGADVFGPDGNKVGNVEDLILDEQQKITGVVVGVGGFLGIGEKRVGLNWQQAQVMEGPDTTAKKIVINLTKADLQAAPAFKTKAERQAEDQAAAQQKQMQQQMPPTTPPAQPSQ
jgi:sporulation protein YlmC with PRC-barrel domain